ncbi:12464_t:CDS:2 [Acaulospora colombiana]|uniref:12464_t:CDS:1 n=1 Tax=Acaulospora colombiana TaxID=27376 RepID=A0ACA9LHK4_9GLOM|nr:12464_t:CDS:2 [Acaulospora colombiana]
MPGIWPRDDHAGHLAGDLFFVALNPDLHAWHLAGGNLMKAQKRDNHADLFFVA